MADTRVRLGIVGLGNWSKQIFQAVDQLLEVKIARCYSRYPDTRKAFASEYDCVACEQYEKACRSCFPAQRVTGFIIWKPHQREVCD